MPLNFDEQFDAKTMISIQIDSITQLCHMQSVILEIISNIIQLLKRQRFAWFTGGSKRGL